MKHDYTDEQIQAAIDAAFNTQSNVPWGSLDTRDKHDGHWKNEAPSRLSLARGLLERLPSPAASQDSQPAYVGYMTDEAPTPAAPTVDPVENAKAHAKFQAELESVWNANDTTPLWTPAVGDVVRLKSGGDVLTVTEYDAEKNQWRCVGLTGGCPCYLCVPLACLTPAKEEQP
jgi:hypothetical protein